MDRRTLRFRRHLAACLLLMLVQELHLISHKRLPEDGETSARRVRLASASALERADFLGQDYNNKFQRLGEQSDNLMMRTSLLNDDDDDFDLVAATLEFIGNYLPTLNFNYTILEKQFSNQQLDLDVEHYYRQNFPPNMSLEQLQLNSIKAALRVAAMPIHLSWGYESRSELRQGSLPVQDDARCMAHLGQLSARLDKLTSSNLPATSGQQPEVASVQAVGKLAAHQASPVENFEAAQLYKSTDLQFLRYLDTFGKAPSDMLRGNMKWYGSYSGCLDTKLRANPQLGGTRRIKFRYCMAGLKATSWLSGLNNNNQSRIQRQQIREKQSSKLYGVHSTDIQMENYFIRIGVCLPESCDSSALDYQENWQNLEKLLKFNLMKPFNSDHYYLSDLYCLPDSRSPLRSIPIAGKLLILATLGWLGLVLLATTVHLNVERFYTKAVKEIRRKQEERAARKHFESSGSGSSSRSGGSKSSGASLEQQQRANSQHNNEFAESDLLHLKQNWIRLNVYIWDLSRRLVAGVDLIACLSLYSNWLKYTNRLKVAIVELHSEQERRQRIAIRNRKLVEEARAKQVGRSSNVKAAKKRLATSQADGEGEQIEQEQAASNEQLFDQELNKRLKAQDDSDELDSDNVKRRVDTSSLNALKVIALFWIIAGHCIFYLGSTISNGAILMNYVRDIAGFALANGALYITELFFVITGCLTAYLAFKYNTYAPPVVRGKDTSGIASAGTEPVGKRERSSLTLEEEAPEEEERPVFLESRIFKLPFWIMICINRYLRILPTYLVVYSFVKLVSVYIGGRGQLWDYAVSANSMRRQCVQESWLPVLTLSTNFIDIYNHCIIGGWYLSADMQFMLMAVPMLLVLAYCSKDNRKRAEQFVAFSKPSQELTITSNRNGADPATSGEQNNNNNQLVLSNGKNQIRITKRVILGYAFIFSIGLFTGILSMIYGIVKSEVDLSYILKFLPHTVAILSRNIAMYTNSILRLRAFAFGLILGHSLYLYEFKLIRLPKFIQQHGAKVTTIVFSIGFCIMFLPIIYPQEKLIVSHDLTSILMILSAGGIDIFLCILIFLLCIGKAPKVVLFLLNSPFWTVLSSLSLCAFLVHTEIIILLTSQLNPPPTVQYSLLLFVFCATLILTYILALALYLSFEMPVSRLIEALMRKHFASTKLVQSDNPAAAGSGSGGAGST